MIWSKHVRGAPERGGGARLAQNRRTVEYRNLPFGNVPRTGWPDGCEQHPEPGLGLAWPGCRWPREGFPYRLGHVPDRP